MILHLTKGLSPLPLYGLILLGFLTGRPTLGQTLPTSPLNLPQSLQLTIDGVSSFRNIHLYDRILTLESPQIFTDPSQLITVGCAEDEGNVFVVKGRGGLPEDPTQTLSTATIWSDLRPSLETEDRGDRSFEPQPTIVEAQRWIVNQRGNIELVADEPFPPAQFAILSQPCPH
jgi:large exoprotein involved in heme utilization and adhesion